MAGIAAPRPRPRPAAAGRWRRRPTQVDVVDGAPAAVAGRIRRPRVSWPAICAPGNRLASSGRASLSRRAPSVGGSRSTTWGSRTRTSAVDAPCASPGPSGSPTAQLPPASRDGVDLADRGQLVDPPVQRVAPPRPHGRGRAREVDQVGEHVGDREREPAAALGVPGPRGGPRRCAPWSARGGRATSPVPAAARACSRPTAHGRAASTTSRTTGTAHRVGVLHLLTPHRTYAERSPVRSAAVFTSTADV